MPARSWSPEELRSVGRRREEDESWDEIGESYGLSGNAVQCAWRRRPKTKKQDSAPEFKNWQEPEDVGWREILDNAAANQDLSQRINPLQEHLTINIPTEKPIAICKAADFHIGGGFTNHKAVRRTLELILETPGMYMSANGDMIEGFIPGEKSAETVEQMPLGLRQQLAANRNLVQEFVDAKKLLWWMWGDHDAKWFEKLVGVNIVKMMTDRVVPYFNAAATVKLQVGEEEYLLYINHSLPGTSMYNPNHAQGRAHREQVPADVVVSAHKHKPAMQWYYKYERMRELGYNLGGKVLLVHCGTFKTGPDPYTCRTWSRGIIGVPTVIYWPGEHKTLGLDNPEDAAVHLKGLAA